MPLTYGSELLKKTASQSFWNSFYTIPNPFEGLVYTKPSTQSTEVLPRLGSAPMPRKWVGNKIAKAVPEYSISITNDPFEATVKVDKKLIKFQQWDEIGNLVANLGEKTRAHQTKLLSDLLNAGDATAGDDTQFYFDTDHADPGAAYTTAQDNDLTANATDGAAPTDLEMAAAIRAMRNSLYERKDDQGDPQIPPSDAAANFVVMVPPKFLDVAERVLIADSLTGPVGNDLRGRFTVRVNPFLTAPSAGTGKFYMLYAGSNHKPLILQEAGGVELDDTMEGDEHFGTGDVAYSGMWWGQTAYGQWRTAVQYKFT